MKLNKPPVTEEQTALEEYVDFLLTDLSNVTPIHTKRVNKKQEQTSISKNKSESAESTSPPMIVAVDNSQKQEVTEVEPVESDNQITKSQVKNKQSLASIEEDVAGFITKELVPEKNELQLNTNEHHEFIPESEEDELKKWDAVLTKEKEMEILAKEQHDKEELIKKERLRNKNEHEQLTREPHKKIVTSAKAEVNTQHERPPIFDEGLPEKEPDERLLKVEKLLARISLATKPLAKKEPIVTPELKVEPEIQVENEISEETAQATFLQREITKTKDMLPEVFQTLIFNVEKLPLAVPLLKLGGIVPMSEEMDITPLVGTPDWFLGLMPHDKGNLMVVDTQKYLMPEQAKKESKEYQYLILLDNSNWALACHDVGDAKNLTQDDIRWSEKSSKRPWFGGMVVDYMSALIEVDELINMLAGNISE